MTFFTTGGRRQARSTASDNRELNGRGHPPFHQDGQENQCLQEHVRRGPGIKQKALYFVKFRTHNILFCFTVFLKNDRCNLTSYVISRM